MSHAAYVYYPRGYRRAVGGDQDQHGEVDERASKLMDAKVMISQGDKEVCDLYEQWRTSGTDVNDWSYVSSLIRCAHRLIPSITDFIRQQESNRRVHGMNFDFLTQLVKVMHAQHCDISPLTALELMDEDPVPQGNIKGRKVLSTLSTGATRGVRPPELSTWLARSGSIEAIVCTLYVLFGTKLGVSASELS